MKVLIRFARNWNVGILESWNTGLRENVAVVYGKKCQTSKRHLISESYGISETYNNTSRKFHDSLK